MIIKLKNKDNSFTELLKYLESNNIAFNEVEEINSIVIPHLDDLEELYDFSCVDKVVELIDSHGEKKIPIIHVGDVEIGGNKIVVIGGPCSVESEEQMDSIVEMIIPRVDILRGGAFKPRTSPYSFQGLREDGIKILEKTKGIYNIPIISEIVSLTDIELFENVDIIQVGARNMQNFELLKALGKTNKPILLKRGFSNTIEEWIMSAEYVISNGNPNVILCERGIRTFETYTRNTLDLSAVIAAKRLTNLPVFVDPSHASGKWDFVEDLSKAAIAAGCDGLMIEIHHDPEEALSDGAQSLKPKKFKRMFKSLRKVAEAVGRRI